MISSSFVIGFNFSPLFTIPCCIKDSISSVLDAQKQKDEGQVVWISSPKRIKRGERRSATQILA